ncbi:glycosyl transferase family 90 [Shimia sediminis]|uniref:glycosyl transferase family 90 n=1 Tax=Shimia sediminis TaxID=2497945 RepID=UPI000F8CA619|nr:glycosyl transferase family 90 [Shimia sediminis]
MRRSLTGLRKWGEIIYWMRQADAAAPRFRVRHSDDMSFVWDVAIDPIPGGFELIYSNDLLSWKHPQFVRTIGKIAPALFARARAGDGVGRIVVNVSDGDYFSNAGFMYCTNWEPITTLPDWYFFRSHGFRDMREKVTDLSVPWDQRTEDIVWRGGVTGNGYFTVFPHLMTHPKTIQRLHLAERAKGTELDFAFRHPQDDHRYAALQQAGLIRDRIPATDWFGKKFAVDIDGFSCTWDNFFHRLLMGCCVLKVGSAFGYRQWYYGDLRPFEHYVPIRADLSDLEEKLAWVRAHDSEARAIAEAGQQLALAMTFEREMLRGAEAIEENWARYV